MTPKVTEAARVAEAKKPKAAGAGVVEVARAEPTYSAVTTETKGAVAIVGETGIGIWDVALLHC